MVGGGLRRGSGPRGGGVVAGVAAAALHVVGPDVAVAICVLFSACANLQARLLGGVTQCLVPGTTVSSVDSASEVNMLWESRVQSNSELSV